MATAKALPRQKRQNSVVGQYITSFGFCKTKRTQAVLVALGVISASIGCSAQTVGRAYTLSTLAPYMMSKMGFGDPSYTLSSMASSPVTAVAGDVSDQFVAPNGQLVTVTVQSPVTTKTFNANPIAQGQDPLAYFQQKITTVGSSSKLVIPKATYNFAAIDCTNTADPSYHAQHVLFQGMHDLVVDFQGSTLNFTSACPGIFFYNATRVVLQNFTIDYPTLQTSALGTIVAVGGNATSGYTYNLQVGQNTMTGFNRVTAWDSVNNYFSLTRPDDDVGYTTSVTLPVNGGVIPNLPSGINPFALGESVLIRNQYTGTGISVSTSQDVTLNNVIINAAPGEGFWAGYGRGLHLNNCQVARVSGRLISTTADAVHFASFGGDVIIENSAFGYQGDDGINMHTAMQPIATLPSCLSPTANCPTSLPSTFGAKNGDSIALFSTFMRLTSTQTAVCAGTACTVNVAPIAALGGFAADMNLPNARYVIQNNAFTHNRARGLLAQTPYGLVQNNSFVGQTAFPLYLTVSSFWDEGPGAQNVLFLNNQFSSPGTGLGAVVMGTEDVTGAVVYDSTPASANGQPYIPGTQQNIVFAKNSFSNLPGAAFYISSANNVILYKNTLGNTNTTTSGRVPNINAPVAIYDASNILLSGNTATVNGHALGPNYSLVASDATSAKITVQ